MLGMLLFAAQPMVILRTRLRGRRRPFCWRTKIETWHNMNKFSLPLVSVLPALVLWSPFTWAEQSKPPSEQMSDAELDQRLKFIATRLAKRTPGARRWQYGWTGFYAVSAAAQTALAVETDDNDDEVNYIVGAVKSSGALAQMLIKPLPAVQSSARLQAMPSQSRAERLRKLEQGEALLRENAARAAGRSGWKRHLIGIGVNLVGGAVTAAYGDSDDAVTSTLIGIAVSETNIWTEPWRTTDDLRDYQNNGWAGRGASQATWRLVPMADRVTLHITF